MRMTIFQAWEESKAKVIPGLQTPIEGVRVGLQLQSSGSEQAAEQLVRKAFKEVGLSWGSDRWAPPRPQFRTW